MINNNLTEKHLNNPQYLNLEIERYGQKRKKVKFSIPIIFLIILSIIPLSFIYIIGTGFTIGGLSFISSNLSSISTIRLNNFIYNLIITLTGFLLIYFAFYLTSLIIKITKK